MKVNLNKKDSVEIEVDKHLKYILIVCSHERSGTHFLMNSISENSPYSVKPWLNFDLSPLGDIARIGSSFNGFKKAMAIADSPNNGLNFCMGCWSEMGENVIATIEHFLSKNQIFYVHFRDVQGTVPTFNECFLGEGNVDIVKAMRALYKGGFTGFLIDDHVPTMIGDSEWGSRGRALETGKMMGLLAAIKSEEAAA